MGEVVIVRLPDSAIKEAAETLRVWIAAALDHAHGELCSDDILDGALKGLYQIWTIHKKSDRELVGVVTTQVITYPRLVAVRIVTIAGVGLSWWARDLNDELESFCREHKAERMEAFGRKGLERKLSPLAFRPVYTAYIKEVANV